MTYNMSLPFQFQVFVYFIIWGAIPPNQFAIFCLKFRKKLSNNIQTNTGFVLKLI